MNKLKCLNEMKIFLIRIDFPVGNDKMSRSVDCEVVTVWNTSSALNESLWMDMQYFMTNLRE